MIFYPLEGLARLQPELGENEQALLVAIGLAAAEHAHDVKGQCVLAMGMRLRPSDVTPYLDRAYGDLGLSLAMPEFRGVPLGLTVRAIPGESGMYEIKAGFDLTALQPIVHDAMHDLLAWMDSIPAMLEAS